MADYNILLGVEVNTSDVQTKINGIQSKLDPIKITIDTNYTQKQINTIKSQIQSLNNFKINLGTSSKKGVFNSGINEANKAYSDLMNLAKRINSIRFQISGLDSAKNAGQIQELSGQLNRLMTDYNNLYNTFTKGLNTSQLDIFKNKINSVETELEKLRATEQTMSKQGMDTSRTRANIDALEKELNELHAAFMSISNGLTVGQIDSLANTFQVTTDKASALTAKIADAKAEMARGITGNFGKYDAEIISLENRFNSLATKPEAVRIAIDSVKQALVALKAADGTDELIASNEAYKEILKQVEAQLKQLELTERGSNNADKFNAAKEAAMRRLNSLFSEGSAAAKVYGNTVEQLRNELNSCGNIQGVQNVTRKINALGTEIKNTHIQTKTWGENIKNQFSKYSTYFSVASVIMYSVQALRSMFEQVKAIDSAMTELKKVTDETDASYNQFLSNAASRAKEIGTTIDGLVQSTADFARLGYNFKDAAGLAEVANIYAVVGDEIEGVEQATESLISTMAAFKDEAANMSNSDFAMSIIDKFNEIGNNFLILAKGDDRNIKINLNYLT